MILTKRYKESAAVTPCARLSFGENGLPMDIHLVVKYAVHHSKAVFGAVSLPMFASLDSWARKSHRCCDQCYQ